MIGKALQNWQSIGTKLFIIGVFTLLTGGCSQHQNLPTAIEDYHQRLARVLDTETLNVEFLANLPFPTKSDVYRQPQPISFNFREFYSLPNCRLNTLIAERNTGLGKTQLPSQRFIYETDMLAALNDCIEISEDEKIKNKLGEVLQEKQKQYADSYANLMQSSDEVTLSFAHASGFVSGDPSDGLHQTQIALQYLLKLNNLNLQEASVDGAQLEASLKDLIQFRLVARMWRSQQLITQWFEAITPWLENHTAELICTNRSDRETLQYLNNVFMLYFVEEIQPIAGQLNNYHYKLLPVLQSFSNNVQLDPEWRGSIITHISNQHQNYKQAMQNHIVVWQTLLKRCGMSPTVPKT